MDTSQACVTEKQWENLLSTLSPSKIAALEKSLKTYQNRYQTEEMTNSVSNDKENDEFDDLDVGVKSEPVTTTKPFLNAHKTKNRGLTYENGRRNLKSEQVTAEEKERRAKRRERNRVAAQKCRERRQQQIEVLQQQVESLRSTEQELYSTLKELSEEETQLRIKLSNHNCVITESSNGEVSYIMQNNQQLSRSMCCQTSQSSAVESLYLQGRPKSLPVVCQSYYSDDRNASLQVDQFISKEESLTPLLSPDSYNILKSHLKAENTLTTPQTKMDTVSKRSETDSKVAFSWSISMVDQLSMPCGDQSTNIHYLSTPVIDMPFYPADSYTHTDNRLQPMDWQSSR